MKKQLITGALALVVGGILSSCHNDEGLYGSIVEQKMQAYQELFVQEFGEIDPNQDWGFGISSIAARTRAEDNGYSEPTANIWADQGYKAPRELTAGQKLRVKAYFQANPNLTYEDPHYTNFFVQQVYKGGTDPGSLSAEVYQAVNGTDITGSERMDHLTFGMKADGSPKDHVYNFNRGRYGDEDTTDPNGKPRENVQNYPGVEYLTTYTGDDGKSYHKDHIMLMLGSSTECVGFYSSEPSMPHNDCMALASAEDIDEWAKKSKNYVNGSPIGEDVVDEWNRSFVGLDYEAMPLEDAYTNPKRVAKAKDFMADGTAYILYNGQIVTPNQVADFDLKDKYNRLVYYLKDDVSNMAVGKKMKDSNNNEITKDYFNYNLSKDVLENTYHVTGVEHQDERIFDLDRLITFPKDNCLPTSSNKNWIKDVGGRDYVFSDWIITLTSADDTQTIPIITDREESSTAGWHQEGYLWECENSGRVFCEDLGVVRASDIDFNDLVFDAYIFKKTPVIRYWKKDSNGNMEYWKDEQNGAADYYAEVYLLAAGGTLDLTINGTSVKPYMKVGKTTILNTIMLGGEDYGNESDIKNQAPEKLVFEGVSSIANIPIVVFYKEENQMTPLELAAFRGAAPHKLCVPIDTQWPIERAEIKLAYPDFTNYVKGQDSQGKKIIWRPNGTTENDGSYYEEVNNLWNNKNTNYLYTKTVSYPVPDTSSKFESTGVVVVDQSTTTTGGYNNETILIRRRN